MHIFSLTCLSSHFPRILLSFLSLFLSVAVLRGGFQQVMAQTWSDDPEVVASGGNSLTAGVQREQWTPNGRQGLVWIPDLDPLSPSRYIASPSRYAGPLVPVCPLRTPPVASA